MTVKGAENIPVTKGVAALFIKLRHGCVKIAKTR
jgi:hypothetical protein